MTILKLPEDIVKELEHKHYGIVGNHSAVQICDWTKKSLRNQGECYKRLFYGVETFSCAQMSPCAMWCDQNCIFCWRPAESMLKKEITETVDLPKDIVEGVLREKYKLLIGFKGFDKINREKLDISLNEFPSHWAISLSGEPTLYPLLPELIEELKSHSEVKSVFLVSNAQNPEMIKTLNSQNALPTQLYLSLDASNEQQYRTINRGIRKDGWQRLNTTLDLLRDLPTRTVIRLTLIKDLNTDPESLKEFAKIIERSQPDFIEIKSYMWIGDSRKRLVKENMPSHDDIKEFAKIMEPHLPSFKYEDEQESSRILLYLNKGNNRTKPAPNKWIIEEKDWRCV